MIQSWYAKLLYDLAKWRFSFCSKNFKRCLIVSVIIASCVYGLINILKYKNISDTFKFDLFTLFLAIDCFIVLILGYLLFTYLIKRQPLNRDCIEKVRCIFIDDNVDEPKTPDLEVFAIDWNSPQAWYKRDMLTYLAIQSQWIQLGGYTTSNGKERRYRKITRTVKRIFIWDDIDWHAERILYIHAAMGFDACVVKPHKAYSIVTDTKYLRDVIFWDVRSKGKGIIVPDLSHDLDEGMYGFESKWRALEVPPKVGIAADYMRGIKYSEMEKYSGYFNDLYEISYLKIFAHSFRISVHKINDLILNWRKERKQLA